MPGEKRGADDSSVDMRQELAQLRRQLRRTLKEAEDERPAKTPSFLSPEKLINMAIVFLVPLAVSWGAASQQLAGVVERLERLESSVARAEAMANEAAFGDRTREIEVEVRLLKEWRVRTEVSGQKLEGRVDDALKDLERRFRAIEDQANRAIGFKIGSGGGD